MTDVKGLDFTPQLFFTGSDVYAEQMALLIDNNDTSCVTLTKCSDGSRYSSHKLQNDSVSSCIFISGRISLPCKVERNEWTQTI